MGLVTTSSDPLSQQQLLMRYSCYDPTWHECINTPAPGDPNPDSVGIYLGENFTWNACTASGGADNDGFDDFCEFQIALAFRPLLATNPNDGALSRETYWAARRNSIYLVAIYALGYHWDGGSEFGLCGGDPSGGCLPHVGDAEWIEVKVKYNSSTQHWELSSVTMSQHGESSTFILPEFPTKFKHYPRVWVSRGKHANYAGQDHCEGGGFLGADTCAGNVDDERVEVWSGRNLGSGTNHYIDDVNTTLDPYRYSGYENFWSTTLNFCGWDGQAAANGRSGCSRNTTYGSILEARGFTGLIN